MALDKAEIQLVVRGKEANATLRTTEENADDVRQALGAAEEQAEGVGGAMGKSMNRAAAGTRRAANATQDLSGSTGSATGIIFNFGQAVEDSSYSLRGALNNISQMGNEFQNLTAQTGSSRAAISAVTSTLMSPVGLLAAVQVGVSAFTMFGDKIFSSMNEGKEAVEDFESSFSEMINVVSGRQDFSFDLWLDQAKQLRGEMEDLQGQLDAGEWYNSGELITRDVQDNIQNLTSNVEDFGEQSFGAASAFFNLQEAVEESSSLGNLLKSLGVDVEALKSAGADMGATYSRAVGSITGNSAALSNLSGEAEALVGTLDKQIKKQERASRAFDMLRGSLQGSKKPLRSVREQYEALQERLSRQQEDGVITSLEAAEERTSFLRSALEQLSGLGVSFDTSGIQALQQELAQAEQMRAQLEKGPLPERPETPAFEGEDYTLEYEAINLDLVDQQVQEAIRKRRRAEERFEEQLTRLREDERRIAGESQESILQDRMERTQAALNAEDKTQAQIHNLKLREQQLSNQLAREEQRQLERRKQRVRRYTDELVNSLFSTHQARQRISKTQAEIQRQQFAAEEERLQESLRNREVTQEQYHLRMQRLAERRSQHEKRVEESRAGFMKQSVQGVRDVAVGAIRQQISEFIAKKTTEVLFQQTAEGQKTAATLSGVAARSAALGVEIAESLANAGASMVNAVAKATSWLASTLGPAALLAIPATAAGAYGAFEGAKALFGFEQGGYTGRGAKDEPAGIVHRGEFVMTKKATRGNERGLYGLMSMLENREVTLTEKDLGAMAGFPEGYSTGGMVALTTPAPQLVQRQDEARAQTSASAKDLSGLVESVRRLAASQEHNTRALQKMKQAPADVQFTPDKAVDLKREGEKRQRRRAGGGFGRGRDIH